MTAHPAAAPAELEFMRAHHDYLLAELQPHLPRIPSQPAVPAQQPAAPTASCGLAPRPESVKMARDFTRATLRTWGMTALSDAAELVVSELVTNALRHGLRRAADPGGSGGPGEQPVRLRLLAQPPYLMCLVTDPSHEIPLRRDPDPAAETGRGLHVIEACSSRWGWHLLDDGGKVVWALLPAG